MQNKWWFRSEILTTKTPVFMVIRRDDSETEKAGSLKSGGYISNG